MTNSSLIKLFSLNASSGIPIYRQLIDQIKQAIRMKLLSSGELLPSVRNLASALEVNPMTISKAFAQLESEGVLIRKRGVGMVVSESQSTEIIKELDQAIEQFIDIARQHKLSDIEINTLVQQYLSLH